MRASKQAPDAAKVLIIERVFDAPRERAFEAWITPEDVLQWGGPRDWPVVATEADVRPGGRWHSLLRSVEDGTELRQGGVYREIDEPELLVFTFAWEDDPEPDSETLITIRFEDIAGGKTKMMFRQEPFATVSDRDGHRGGWSSAFDRLDELLATP